MRITTYKALLNEERHPVLVKERATNYAGADRLSSPRAVMDMLCTVFEADRRAEEHGYLIAMDAKNKPAGVFEISHGAVNFSILQTREVFIRLLLSGASGFILAHNHPSGDPSPSGEDIAVTKKFTEAGKLMEVPLIDHIIIGDGRYYSMRENGILK